MHVYICNAYAAIRNNKTMHGLECEMFSSIPTDSEKYGHANIAEVRFSRDPHERGNLLHS